MSKKRMRIALVSDAVLPFNKGGKETRIFHLTREMVKLGHEVHVYTMQWWTDADTYVSNGVTYHAISRLYPLYADDRRSIKQGILFGIATLKMFRYDFDILEVDHMPFFPLYAAKIVCLIKRRPLFATWHEVWGKTYWQEYLGKVPGIFAYVVERTSVLLPDHIIAVSPHTEKLLRKSLHYHGKLTCIHNGVDLQKIEPVQAAPTPSDVIYAGRLLPHKNVVMLVEAIGKLRAKRPDIRCEIIGDGPEATNVREEITRLGLEKNITMTGFLESSVEVYSHLKASKVFVLPSVREGFGIAVLEAYVCGLRVVTVDHPDNAARNLMPEGAGMVCTPTAAALATSIETLLADKPTKPERAQLVSYDWGECASQLSEVYAV